MEVTKLSSNDILPTNEKYIEGEITNTVIHFINHHVRIILKEQHELCDKIKTAKRKLMKG